MNFIETNFCKMIHAQINRPFIARELLSTMECTIYFCHRQIYSCALYYVNNFNLINFINYQIYISSFNVNLVTYKSPKFQNFILF